MAPGFSVREDNETKFALRRRAALQRRVRRQVAPVPDPEESESESESSESSGPESESEGEGEESEDEIEETAVNQSRISGTTPLPTSISGSGTVRPTTTLALSTQQPTSLSTSTTTTATRQPQLATSLTQTGAPTAPTGRLGVAPVPEGVSADPPRQQTRAHKTLSHDATIALEVIGILVGVSIFLGICFVLFRRYKRRRTRSSAPPGSPTTSDSQYGNKRESSVASHLPFARFFSRLPPPSSDEKFLAAYDQSNQGAREQRLDLVKPELLSEKELNGNLMRGHVRTKSEESRAERLALRSGEGSVDVPRKAFLKRDTSGKMVMKPTDHGGKGDQRVMIEASGEWDEARTVARASVNTRTPPETKGPLSGLTAALRVHGVGSGGSGLLEPQGAKTNDPTLVSGGLRSSSTPLSAMRGLDNRADGVPYDSREQQRGGGGGSQNSKESGALGGFANLNGLRRGDGGEEFERLARERQSMMSGTVRSTTSWNTSVWGRLEKEREKMNLREKMEGGMGGGAVGAGAGAGVRDSTISVPRWRDPVSWVKDQVERTDRGKGQQREKAGMERLDG